MIDRAEYDVYIRARMAGSSPRQALALVRIRRAILRTNLSVRKMSQAMVAFGVALRPAVKKLSELQRALQKQAALQRSREAAAQREMQAFARRKGRLK